MQTEDFIGTVVLFPFDRVPSGWMACEGQLLAISAFQALFSLVGTKFGGDGRTTFAIPDLKGKAPEGLRYFIALEGLYPSTS